MALPGYISAYLQVDASKASATSARNGTSPTTGADARLGVLRELRAGGGAADARASSPHAARRASRGSRRGGGGGRDSWHRFSSRKKSHGWCDFARSAVRAGLDDGTTRGRHADGGGAIIFLNESSELVAEPASSGKDEPPLTGKFTWTVENLRHFAVMLKTQKVMSPSFVVGDCAFRLSAYQSAVKRSARARRTPRTARPSAARPRTARPSACRCAWRARRSTRSAATKSARSRRGPRRSARAPAALVKPASRKWRATPRSARLRASRPAGRAGLCSGLPPRTRRTERRACIGTRTDASPATRSEGTRRALGGTISCPWRRSRGGRLNGVGRRRQIVEGGGTGFLEGPDGRAVFSVSFHAARGVRGAHAPPARGRLRRAGDRDPRAGRCGARHGGRARRQARLRREPPDPRRGRPAAPLREARRAFIERRRGGRRVRRGVSGGVSVGHPFAGDAHDVVGRFVWRLDNFTKLKDILKKRKMSGLSRAHRGGFPSAAFRAGSSRASASRATPQSPLDVPGGGGPRIVGPKNKQRRRRVRVSPAERVQPAGPREERLARVAEQVRHREGLGMARVSHAHDVIRRRRGVFSERHRGVHRGGSRVARKERARADSKRTNAAAHEPDALQPAPARAPSRGTGWRRRKPRRRAFSSAIASRR